MATKHKILIILILLTVSCNYKWTTITDTNGEKYRIRAYNDYDKQEQYNEKSFFKHQYGQENHSKYLGSIQSDTANGYNFIQFDTVRIYLLCNTKKYLSIFTIGLLSGQLIYCTLDSLCRPQTGTEARLVETGELLKPHIGNWYGHTITIAYFDEPEYLKISPQKRRFKFWVSWPNAGNGHNIFFIELTNNKVTKYIDIDEFVKEAQLTFIRTPWAII
ncbi:MAG: hypothetical protein IIA88_01820 [Bacteroidetes bacterium]|nr:hypothetical protein [Bacteroidota bacterium]